MSDTLDTKVAFDDFLVFSYELRTEDIINYKFVSGEQVDELIENLSEIKKEIIELNKFLIALLKIAFRKHLHENGSWSISEQDYDLKQSKFLDKIAEVFLCNMVVWKHGNKMNSNTNFI